MKMKIEVERKGVRLPKMRRKWREHDEFPFVESSSLMVDSYWKWISKEA